MVELRRKKVLQNGHKIGLFAKKDDIVNAMEICLESIESIKNLMDGLEYG